MYYLSICTLSYNGSVLFYLFTIFSPLWFLVVFIWNTKTSIRKRLTLSLMAQVHLNKIWQFPSLIKQKHFTVAIYILEGFEFRWLKNHLVFEFSAFKWCQKWDGGSKRLKLQMFDQRPHSGRWELFSGYFTLA